MAGERHTGRHCDVNGRHGDGEQSHDVTPPEGTTRKASTASCYEIHWTRESTQLPHYIPQLSKVVRLKNWTLRAFIVETKTLKRKVVYSFFFFLIKFINNHNVTPGTVVRKRAETFNSKKIIYFSSTKTSFFFLFAPQSRELHYDQ